MYYYLISSGSNGFCIQNAVKWQCGDAVNHRGLPRVKVECNPTFAVRQATMRLVTALPRCRFVSFCVQFLNQVYEKFRKSKEKWQAYAWFKEKNCCISY